jgi:hypothetical protein
VRLASLGAPYQLFASAFPISNQQSSISNPQSAILNQQSSISNPQSAILNQQSSPVLRSDCGHSKGGSDCVKSEPQFAAKNLRPALAWWLVAAHITSDDRAIDATRLASPLKPLHRTAFLPAFAG